MTGGGGYIEKDEFACLVRDLFFFARLWDFFSDIDVSSGPHGDRRITRKELARAVADKKFALPRGEDVNAVFSKMDADRHGIVLFNEFCDYVTEQFPNNADLNAAFIGMRMRARESGKGAGKKSPRKAGKPKKKSPRTPRSPRAAAREKAAAEGRKQAQLASSKQPPTPAGMGSLVCPTCGRNFFLRGRLSAHQRIAHTK